MHPICRDFFLSINRFERKKNLRLAIDAFSRVKLQAVRSSPDGVSGSPGLRASGQREFVEKVEKLKLVIAGTYNTGEQ